MRVYFTCRFSCTGMGVNVLMTLNGGMEYIVHGLCCVAVS